MSEINLPPFYIGQRVVCIEKITDAMTNRTFGEKIVNSKQYNVSICVWDYFFGEWFVVVTGMRTQWAANSFVPVQENFESISLEKVIEKEKPLTCAN